MDILFYEKERDLFLSALEGTDFTAPTRDQFVLQSEYNSHYYGATFHDVSFLITERGRVKAVVPCHIIDNKLCMNNRGICPYYRAPEKKLVRAIFSRLTKITKDNTVSQLVVREDVTSHEIDPWGYEAYKAGAIPKTILKAEINLNLPRDEIHRGVRDSYRSLITLARRELDIRHMTAETISADLFDQFRLFHLSVAERETRNHKSWDTQYKMVKAGCAELIVAYMEPYGLVASALYVDYAKETSYAVGVYNRELFDRPLAHALMYDAIFRAKDRKQDWFHLGILPHMSEASTKELSIAQFKKGFCDRPFHDIEWLLPFGSLNAEDSES